MGISPNVVSPADGVVHIASVTTAVPPLQVEQQIAGRILEQRFQGTLRKRCLDVLRNVFAHPSVLRRHFALTRPAEIFVENPDERSERFTTWAVDLGSRALSGALRSAGVATSELSALVVNTCTGYLCPGISTYLVETLGLPEDLRVYDLVGGGCGGLVPNLELAERIARTSAGPVACVATEVCSATFEMGNDLGLIVSNALFADGASAMVLQRGDGRLRLIDSASLHSPEHREHVRYIYRDGRLHNQITMRLPKLVAAAADTVVRRLLDSRGLRLEDIDHWAVHPGGEKILQTLAERFGLTAEQLAPSRCVLARYGNLSSATLGFVLRDVLEQGIVPGQWCLALTFGAGLSAHAYLMQA
jgi:predicted naringenin-chalcone synthase